MTTATAFEIRTLTPHPTLEYWSVCKIEALFETPFFRFGLSGCTSASRKL
ncbi:biotin synthase [Pasteurella multocida]|nr:biotin synthase [Pasteurella multocida]